MNLILVSKRKDLQDYFGKAAGLFRSFEIILPSQIEKLKTKEDFLVYINVDELSASKKKKWDQKPDLQRGAFGYINMETPPEDPAALIHQGYVDAVGKNILETNPIGRMNNVLHFLDQDIYMDHTEISWEEYIEGKMYPFLFFYVEMDHVQELKNKLGREQYQKVCDYFKRSIEEWIPIHQGIIWMWQNEGGLILFPAKGDPEPLLGAIRFFLNRYIHQTGWFSSALNLKYHGVFAHYTAEYRSQGTTGGIISDQLNTFFHITKKCTEAGRLFVSEDVLVLLKEKLQDFFVPFKVVEEEPIFVLRKNC